MRYSPIQIYRYICTPLTNRCALRTFEPSDFFLLPHLLSRYNLGTNNILTELPYESLWQPLKLRLKFYRFQHWVEYLSKTMSEDFMWFGVPEPLTPARLWRHKYLSYCISLSEWNDCKLDNTTIFPVSLVDHYQSPESWAVSCIPDKLPHLSRRKRYFWCKGLFWAFSRCFISKTDF